MKVLGITAEYNPFHNGHKYHIEESRRITGADCVVAVMSGYFTQRGEAAALDKWTRSRLAVANGADLVVELPFVYACNIAERFAKGAVDILAGLGADYISFGSESGDIKSLTEVADLMVDKAEMISLKRTEIMQSGASFAKAGQLAVEELFGKSAAALMSEPNNILAIEYLKRIKSINSAGGGIEAVTVKRHGSGYFELNDALGFAGASAIRKMEERTEFEKFVPADVADALGEAESKTACENRSFDIIRAEILKNSSEDLAKIYHMGEGLENKLKKEIVKATDMDSLISSIVSKRYTEAAVRRLLVYVLLGIRQYQMPEGVYARILAANDKGRELLSKIKKRDDAIPVITNINKATDVSDVVKETLSYDVMAADMYNLIQGKDIYDFSDKVIKPYMDK